MITPQLQEEFANLLRDHVPALSIQGPNATGQVPWRKDNHPSFSANITKGTWYDHATKEGGGVKEFKARLGLNGIPQASRKIVATYDYTDEHGALLYQVLRFDPKDFRQRKPDGNGGWSWNLNDVRRVLYRLPEISKVKTVYIVEGEKDADRLWSLGLPATTCPSGAGKWKKEYSEMLRGNQVVLLPDNDGVGEKHAQAVAQSLLPVAKAVKIVRLPDLVPKGDVSDWLDAGHTKEELATLVREAPLLKPEDLRRESQSQSNELPLTKLGDLLDEPEEDVSWLVDQLLPSGGFSLLVAKPKAGKSTLARNLALSIAHGDTFLNRATQRGAVIYLALEEKRSEVRKHFKEMGASGEEEIYVFAASAPLDVLQQIRTVAEEKNPALIIIDPLFRFTRVKDGNDYAQVTAALEPLLVLARETGAHVLCVHHAGKGERDGGDSILGSTAIFAAVDTALIMKRSERYRTISSVQRYGEDLPETVLRFDSTTRTLSLGESKEIEEEKRIGEAIVEFIKAKGVSVIELEINAEVEGRKAVKTRALRDLVEREKRVFRDGDGKRGAPFRYALDKSWFSSSQSIDGNQGTRNGKVDITPRKDEKVSSSRQHVFPEIPVKTQEPESSTKTSSYYQHESEV